MTTTKFFHFRCVHKLMFLNIEGTNKQPPKNPEDHIANTPVVLQSKILALPKQNQILTTTLSSGTVPLT